MKPVFTSPRGYFRPFTISIKNVTASCLYKMVTVLLLFCFTVNSFAQTPVIVKNVSIPSGNANSRGVAYGNGKYITILSAGTIYSSTDGENWTKVVDAGIPAGTFNSISFGAGYFVVVGDNGLILSSANGLNWTVRTSSTTQNLTCVSFLQGAFYVTGMNTTLRRSTDGINFSSITIGAGTATDMFLYITYGNGTFVISARNSGASGIYVYKSATGLSNSWSFQDLGFGTLNRVQYINDRFFVFLASHEIFTSTNASTWTNITASITLNLPNSTTGVWNSSNQIFNGFYDGTKYYFFGSSQYYSGYGSVFSATTGLNFTLQTKTAYIVPQGSAYLNGKYFQTGNEGIVSSNDGVNYKYPTGNYASVASSGTGFVGVGTISSNTGNIFSSADFETWVPRTPLNQQELYGVAYDGSKYLAVGNYTVVESTDNGVSWNEIATPTATYTGLAWGNSKFVAAGYDAGGAKIAYSATGATWTNASTADNYYFRVKFENGNFFALGMDNVNYLGVIMQSADGVTWTNITPNLPYAVYYFNDVVFDGTKYHFMGSQNSDYTFFSVSTATPANPNSFTNKGTIVSPPGGSQLGGDWGNGAFAYSSGKFVGAVNDVADGYKTYVVYSADGVNWTASSVDETTVIAGAVAVGDVFYLLGSGDGKISVSYGALPVDMLSFNATVVNGESHLFWQTNGENYTDNYEVQYSTDGAKWVVLETMKAGGNSAAVLKYRYAHVNPVKGINYYRLKQNDVNGTFSYSSILRLVYKDENTEVLVYPNPVTRQFVTIELLQTTLVQLYNSAGQLVYNQKLSEGKQLVDVSRFTKGIYTLVTGSTVKQLLIQ